ncbi:MAG TPA: hypothetical protein VI454_20465 [Verrucomicrobiae bacterium]|jgi:hypothetical protein
MNFTEQLRRHLGFLGRSCADFDAGHADEALRMAVTLRVLLHDTANSTSLLTHLGIKNSSKLLTTFEPGYTKSDASGVMSVFIPVWVDSTGIRRPPLGEADRQDFIPVSEWWTEVVMGSSGLPSRKDVILAAANQDGGAHVDANPSLKTQELIRGVGTFGLSVGGEFEKSELTDHHFYLIRQFAHEVLNSPDIVKEANNSGPQAST